jgi:hypothetical protein
MAVQEVAGKNMRPYSKIAEAKRARGWLKWQSVCYSSQHTKKQISHWWIC